MDHDELRVGFLALPHPFKYPLRNFYSKFRGKPLSKIYCYMRMNPCA
jgi:hypothetical protein